MAPERPDVGGFLLKHSPVDLEGSGGTVQTTNNSVFNYRGGDLAFGGFNFTYTPTFSTFPAAPKPGDLFYDAEAGILYYFTGDPSQGIEGWAEVVLDANPVNTPRVYVQRFADQTAENGNTVVEFDTEVYNVGFTVSTVEPDPVGEPGVFETRITVPEAGLYVITYQITWNSTPSDWHSAAVAQNGTKFTEVKNEALTTSVEQDSTAWSGLLSAGDVLTLVAFNNSACAETFGDHNGTQPTYLSVYQLQDLSV